ncbi:hypothetical protein L6R52_28570 [Myxococcota bacterium]|nr:hypothetical protein [Myxococcota bacterium]
MTTSYDRDQLIYSFIFSANAVSGYSWDNSNGEGLAAMQAYVAEVQQAILADSTIQGLIGSDWRPVWGPIVYAVDTRGPTVQADNTMGCYYSPSNNLFVIAVAGTNPSSFFDWLHEDAAVGSMVSWASAGGTGSGNISTGANTGLQILLSSMLDGNRNTMLQTLSSYIVANGVTGATIAVGGHSLAGALSPCLALYMQQNQSSWNHGAPQSIAVYASAGPTPGDAAFAATYEAVIKAGKIGYSSVYNPLDVVPLAWAPADLATLPGIYDSFIEQVSAGDSPTNLFWGILAAGLDVLASGTQGYGANPYVQIATGRTALPGGAFNHSVDDEVIVDTTPPTLVLPPGLSNYGPYVVNVARFAEQAVAQHTTEYPPLLGIAAFDAEYQKILEKSVPRAAAPVNGVQAAVKKLTGIDLGKVAQKRRPAA